MLSIIFKQWTHSLSLSIIMHMSEVQPQVTIYSTSWCGFCHTLEQYLEKKGVSFVTKDIEKDETAYHELMDKIGGRQNFRGVPTSDFGGEIVLGFDRPKIDAVLAKNK